MRVFISVITLLLLVSPTMGTVVLNCADLGGGVVELSYDSSQESVPVMIFQLDVSVSDGIIYSAVLKISLMLSIPIEIRLV